MFQMDFREHNTPHYDVAPAPTSLSPHSQATRDKRRARYINIPSNNSRSFRRTSRHSSNIFTSRLQHVTKHNLYRSHSQLCTPRQPINFSSQHYQSPRPLSPYFNRHSYIRRLRRRSSIMHRARAPPRPKGHHGATQHG